jgi:hypothetical protein
MSSWGNLDNVLISGNVTTSNVSATVSGYGGAVFLSNVDAGDYIIIAGNKYQVATVTGDGTLTLTANAATNSDNVKAYVQQGPKYIANVATTENVYTIQNVYGVDRNEIQVAENKARGISHTGWTHYNTYTTSQGATRYKTETLVAMSKNFAANVTGTLFAVGTDAADDDVVADYQINIDLQPVDDSASAGNAVTFLVAVSTTPEGESVSYEWYEDNTSGIAAVVDGGDYSGNTTNTLTISNVSNVDGYSYFVIVSGTSGADSVTSDTATATEV